ncbi:MAG: serine kinase [Clostridia bacterium]|nr:serine kinase [Clostridia bacterium]
MTVRQLANNEGFEALALPEEDRVIDGVYIGDLLSWVMGRAKADNAWITIMSNINIVAVASLADVACIVLAENVSPEQKVIDMANAKGINIIKSALTAYEVAVLLSKNN